jgi:signal peptide peptidase SppA
MTAHRFPFLAQRLFNVPLALAPRKAEIVVATMADRFGIARMFRADAPQTPLNFDDYGAEIGEPASWAPYDVQDGVAIVPIEGTLVNRLGGLTPYSGMTGYDGIRGTLAMALADENVGAVMLEIDSLGGECAGMLDLVDEIYAARGSKPLWAMLSETACSAAYGIASGCDRVLIPRSGIAGSVGVITMHVDYSKQLDKQGIDVTLITFGDRKAEGNEVNPLPPEVKASIKAEITALGEMFVAQVARNRGMTAEAVRATEAGIFLGAAAVQVGFADAVTSPQAALAALKSVL